MALEEGTSVSFGDAPPPEATHAPGGGSTPMHTLVVLSGLSGFHINKEHKDLRGKSDGGGNGEWI